MTGGAVISDNQLYRYRLWRVWDTKLPTVTWIMLNPSTADGKEDDPTIRRSIGFAEDWGCGGIEVVNLFAYRSTDPKRLLQVPDPVGRENNDYIISSPKDLTVAAWGSWAGAREDLAKRVREVRKLVEDRAIFCLGRTASGDPKHPVRLGKRTLLEFL